MSEQPIPVIICGKNPDIAKVVKEGLKPEAEGIHIIMSVEAGVREIPQILRGEMTAASETQMGTGNYADGKSAAVVLGGGYDEAMFEELRAASKGSSNVPWLKKNREKSGPPPGSQPYTQSVIDDVKACLKRLKEEGKMVGDGVYLY